MDKAGPCGNQNDEKWKLVDLRIQGVELSTLDIIEVEACELWNGSGRVTVVDRVIEVVL